MTTGLVQLSPSTEHGSPPSTMLLTLILLVFFFVGFFSMYFCNCFMQNILYARQIRNIPRTTLVGSSASLGLDPFIVKSFPSFSYSTLQGCSKEKYGLECSICLVEFVDDDIFRLLTCCHAFHQECVDLWLESRKTCPVCRKNLESSVQSPVRSLPRADNNSIDQDMLSDHDDHQVSITIKDAEETRVCENVVKDYEIKVQILSRSHSTGHNSMVRSKGLEDDSWHVEEEKKCILRLSENVKSDMMKGRHHHSSCKSWTTFGDYQTKSNTNGLALA